jgi:hypothetical protein
MSSAQTSFDKIGGCVRSHVFYQVGWWSCRVVSNWKHQQDDVAGGTPRRDWEFLFFKMNFAAARNSRFAAQKERRMSNREHAKKEKKPKEHAKHERERIEDKEDEVVLSSDESFPASDPPSFNPGVTGAADTKKKRD